jgi:uncharacterized membrane protein (DUF106 family)
VSLKLLPLLLIITVSAASAGGVVMGKPFYRKGDTLVFTLDAMPEPGAAMLMDARGRNLTLTLTFQDGRFIATYTLAPEDPAGRWRLLLKGGEAATFYVVDPSHTLLGAGVAAGVSLLSAVVRRYTTDLERARRMRAELSQYQREMREALRARDRGKMEKLKKREPYIKRLQAEQMKDQLRYMGITLIPFLLVYYALVGLVGAGTVVAYSPVPIPVVFFVLGPPLTIIWWYIMSSLALGTVITKLAGVALD